jgi:hypothetical protein
MVRPPAPGLVGSCQTPTRAKAETQRVTAEEIVGRLLGQSLSDGLPMVSTAWTSRWWTAGGRFWTSWRDPGEGEAPEIPAKQDREPAPEPFSTRESGQRFLKMAS